jgi:protein phosphatase
VTKSDKASPEEILRVVKSNNSNKACQQLVNLANERGGDDNITTIILKVKTVKREHRGFRAFFSFLLRKLGFTDSASR